MQSALERPGSLSWLARLCVASEVVATYPLVRRDLRRLELAAAVNSARRHTSASHEIDERQGRVSFRLAWIVEMILDRLPGDTRCLTRTLVLTRMLDRRGIGCSVVLGVRVAPAFGSHAWPEVAGAPLMPPIEPGGQRLMEL